MPEWNGIMSQVDSIKAVGEKGKAMAKEIIMLHLHYRKLFSETYLQVDKLKWNAEDMHDLVKRLSRVIQKHPTPGTKSQELFENLTDRFVACHESTIGALGDEWRKIGEDIEKICMHAMNFVVPQNNAIWFRKKDTRIIRTEKFEPVRAACGKMASILLELPRHVFYIQKRIKKLAQQFKVVCWVFCE